MLLDSASTKLTQYLIRNNVISGDDFPIYKYGLELLISSIIETVVICVLGSIAFTLFDAVIFIVCFVLLRSFSGGFHAKSYLRCTVYSTVTFCSVALAAKYLHLGLITLSVISIIDLAVIMVFAPVENPAKPIENDQKPKLRMISTLVCIAFIVVSFVLYCLGIGYSAIIVYSITSVCILVILGRVKEKPRINKQQKKKGAPGNETLIQSHR